MPRTKNSFIRNKLYFGFDNGVSATIAAFYNNEVRFIKIPIKMEQDFTKKKGNISRVDFPALNIWIRDLKREFEPEAMFALIERPMKNPARFSATISAVRALEAVLILIERYQIPFDYIDSKAWQRELLPKGSKGDQLKPDSRDKGIRLCPQFKELITKHKDADGLLIGEYARRYY